MVRYFVVMDVILYFWCPGIFKCFRIIWIHMVFFQYL